ncbi:MAG TPA: aldo/keto reductase [archaeon]|nr:aldo/keto reductase [archaeon]
MGDSRNSQSMGKISAELVSRRDFLKTASAAALGAGAFGLGAGFGRLQAEEQLAVNSLPASVLGRTGLKVTKISFGGVLITEPPLLIRVIDQGINLIHTAPAYQNGRSMEAFGKVFKNKGLRDKVVLALKERPENIDSCLKVLNTDYVDILVPPMTSLAEISDPSVPDNFEKARKAGKARFMGWAGHNNTTEIFDRGRELGYYDVTLMSYANIRNASFLEAARKAREAGIGIFTMKGQPKRNADGSTAEEAATFTSLCSSMVNHQHAHSVLASMGSFQSVDFYRGMLETKLGCRNRTLEDRYWAQQEGNYCSMCGNCEKVCPFSENIPRILRYRMYYKDYGLKDYARAKYAALNFSSSQLTSQDLECCESVCSRRLPLRSMLDEAHRLLS